MLPCSAGENEDKNKMSGEEVPKGWQRDKSTGKLVPLKGDVLTFDFEVPQAEAKKVPPKSLQERFSSFRKEKIKAARSKAFQADENSKQRQDASRMQELREKFIERCKAYYGVPYARRYHEPDSQHYNAPLYLDCCGLVRQVQRDLKDDFGFSPGPWNQAYQFDTLPIRYDSWDQMKPGDLVFAEGKVTKPGLKQQKGNIVHVEVFLGGGPEGKSVCGARWGKGVVQEFDSFDFKAKSWELIRWHFCSIDTWLGGVCKSFHPTREWKRRQWTPGAKSVFATGEEGEEGGEGEEEDVDAEAPEGDGQDGAPGEGKSVEASQAAGLGRDSSSRGARRFFVTPGNQSDLIINAMEGMGWARIPFDQPDDLSFHLRWTEVRSDIHFARLRPREQLVNHFPDANVITTKHGLLRTLRDMQRRRLRGTAAPPPPEGGRDMHTFLPPTFLLSLGSDKVALLQELQAAARGETAPVWVVKPVAANQGHGIFVTRDHAMLMRDYLGWRNPTAPTPERKAADAAPGQARGGDGEKEDVSGEGGGEDGSGREAEAAAEEGEGGSFVATAFADSTIIQRYIADPLLLAGAKFDIRCFMLVASAAPAHLVLFHHGYVRRSLSPYSAEALDDRFVHLTNAAVQKRHAAYATRGGEAIWSMRQLQAELEGGGRAAPGWVDGELRREMMAICREVFVAAQAKLVARRGVFELFGLDFLVDAQLRPWLLEVNANPALWIHSKVQRELFPALIGDTLRVVTEVHERTKDSDKGVVASELRSLEGTSFTLLVDGARNSQHEQFPPLQ